MMETMWQAFFELSGPARLVVLHLFLLAVLILGLVVERVTWRLFYKNEHEGKLGGGLCGLAGLLSVTLVAAELTGWFGVLYEMEHTAGALLMIPAMVFVAASNSPFIRLAEWVLKKFKKFSEAGDQEVYELVSSRGKPGNAIIQPSQHKFESPIEAIFWKEWIRAGGPDALDLQYQYKEPNTGYRIDFAHLPTKVAIELDGYEYHSSKKQFTKDRQRQRRLERYGWRFIRFSGSEIVRNARQCFAEAQELIASLQTSHSGDVSPNRTPLSRKEIREKILNYMSRTDYEQRISGKCRHLLSLEELYYLAAWEVREADLNDTMLSAVFPIITAPKVMEEWIDRLEKAEKGEPVWEDTLEHYCPSRDEVKEKLERFCRSGDILKREGNAYIVRSLDDHYRFAALELYKANIRVQAGEIPIEDLTRMRNEWIDNLVIAELDEFSRSNQI